MRDGDERSAFRRFVLANHPDRGGDPDAFVAGVARFGRGGTTASNSAATSPAAANVVFYRRRRGLKRLTACWRPFPRQRGHRRHRRPRVI